MSEVVVTGLGALSGAGSGVDAFWRAMWEADRPPEQPTAQLGAGRTVPPPLCQSVPDGALHEAASVYEGLPLGRASQAAIQVADMAVRDVKTQSAAPGRLGVIMASGVSDAGLLEEWRAGTRTPPDPWVPSFPAAAAIADRYGAEVAATSPSNACAGGSYAIAMGADLIRAGEADIVIAGAVEMYSRVIAASFTRLGALDPDGVRPFHRARKGTGMGEGAAALVLESAEHAAQRGARVRGRLLSSGWTCDAYHPTAPNPDGEQIARAVREALRGAAVHAGDISLVVPHATGTELNDATEARVLHDVFGPRAAQLPLYSLKALIGHTGSASGALSAVAALLMLEHRRVPRNVPIDDQDPECAVLLSTEPVTPKGRLALVNAFGFGGHNISLLFEGVR
ncbi:beta-ketoacyl-[acyl-carrier-protein] synthase family protein [Streptomyces gobiensis]|uniref:beta-ketoacyl-[acyl-carrier-protein] synthase family protein n=1 Tax=Streptomyces gobiensis TaxID=2875706 RepID=UPI001E4309C6|nr:beta-ketoacyl-[acyl-carrier-protein] synthase family protein [Streptomyces gobiensis]UGY94202.1 beta-ketoacyl-[acyl-carrier-protein] synthase family protein [Streptomyces gobiensis]